MDLETLKIDYERSKADIERAERSFAMAVDAYIFSFSHLPKEQRLLKLKELIKNFVIPTKYMNTWTNVVKEMAPYANAVHAAMNEDKSGNEQ